MADVSAVDVVAGIHHLHVGELVERHRGLEAHVLIAESRTGNLETIKRQIQACLSDHDRTQPSTLEFEFDGSADCDGSQAITPHEVRLSQQSGPHVIVGTSFRETSTPWVSAGRSK